ncbi:hypothetical protein D9615_008264 [Tricholomella constricta]|uniref:Uncharacterized protein n=1 Tax=Tricholomella constricta TaxID=117010 RepID=A0A8H5H362_9AGAR|nr:hypothetical protein D9615_008264 [Tricholomella constricta]
MPTVFLPLSLSRLATWPTSTRTVLSDKEITGVGNSTVLHAYLSTDGGLSFIVSRWPHTPSPILTSLERIAFNGDPLQFLLIQTTYQPFISFFYQTGMINERPELRAFVSNYASAIVIELHRGSPPDLRDFLRIKFKNGTTENFKDVHVFGHRSDIPLTGFIYRAVILQRA